MSPVQEDGDDDDDCVHPLSLGLRLFIFRHDRAQTRRFRTKNLLFPLFSPLCVTSERSPAQTQKVEVYLNYTSSPEVVPRFSFFFVKLGLFVSGSH